MGVLSQAMGTWDRRVAYLSKWLDNVAPGWQGCLRAVAVVAFTSPEGNQADFGPRYDRESPS